MVKVEKVVTINNLCSQVIRHAYTSQTDLIGDGMRSIGHEAANILTGIGGYAELIQYQKPGPLKQSQYLNSILESTGKATKILKTISKFITSANSEETVVGTIVATLRKTDTITVADFPSDLNYYIIPAPESWLTSLIKKSGEQFIPRHQFFNLEIILKDSNTIVIAFSHDYPLPAKLELSFPLPYEGTLRASGKRCALLLPARNLRGSN